MLELTGHRAAEDTRTLAQEMVRSAEAKTGEKFGPAVVERIVITMHYWGDVQLGSDLAFAIARALGIRDHDMDRMARAVTYNEHLPRSSAA